MTAKQVKRPTRIDAVEHCMLGREDGSLIGALLVNLSDEGFCVDSSHPLEVGERVEMRVRGVGQIAGIVRWLDGNRAGGVIEQYMRGAYGP